MSWAVPQTSTLEAGQSNAVIIDRNNDVIAVGKSGTKMVAVKIIGTGTNAGQLASWGDSNSGIVTVPDWPSSTGAVANAIIQLPSGLMSNDLVVGGYETHTYTGNGGACCTACDWAMIALRDDTGVKDGSNYLTSGNGCCNFNFEIFTCCGHHSINGCYGGAYPSNDTINAFTILDQKLLPAGSTNYDARYGTEIAVGCLNVVSGTFDNTYGPDNLGLTIGSPGVAYAIQSTSSDLGSIVAGGTGLGVGDFVLNRFDHYGDWVGAFGSGNGTKHGVFYIDFGGTSTNSNDSAKGVGIAPDGSFIVGGSMVPSGGTAEIALANVLSSNQINITMPPLRPSAIAVPTLSASAFVTTTDAPTVIDSLAMLKKHRPTRPLLRAGG